MIDALLTDALEHETGVVPGVPFPPEPPARPADAGEWVPREPAT